MMIDSLTENEIKVLEMLDGRRPGEWGAGVSACLEFLAGYGLCTEGPKFEITEQGSVALVIYRGEKNA